MQVSKDCMTCFFCDTNVRKDKNTAAWGNRGRFALKLAFVLSSVWMHHASLAYFNTADNTAEGGTLYSNSEGEGGTPLNPTQRALSMACSVMFAGRICLQMFVLWDRVTSWTEVLAEAGVCIPGALLSLGFTQPHSPPLRLYLSFLVFLAGTGLNVASEVQRHLFKRRASNKGKLFVTGLFSVCRHPNYTGEILSFIGFAGVSGVAWNLWIPLAMGTCMVQWSVPELQFYLRQRYGVQWEKYAARVTWNVFPGC
ncbi:hypothetical protein T484DRAFT_1947463 [Baffinella frigidus]|nr:hypothetical protein T484DRAFT_1947463 [Cryptophyta sp. CCMP2293]